MERLTSQTALTQTELRRRRQQEIDSAWGGLNLQDAITSSPNKRSIPSNLSSNPPVNTLLSEGERGISVPNGSSIDAQMDLMNEPVHLANNLYHNYDHIRENNACEAEVEEYLKEMEEAKDPFDEEEKDPDRNYWDQLHASYNRRHINTNPTSLVNHVVTERQRPLPEHPAQEDRPIEINHNGAYNLNFIDWDNEWENAHEAMEAEGESFFSLTFYSNDL